ncbi:hypothetical protein C2845_PM04G11280 [Panicum miliaceum]|uniref:Uncharacterized protein n=1 Tax=Panicum miliaceum TaxID=4540 RepID=A0A3L6QNK0_PANMI|nr:hypothetical protein C2845_PM04G11280 [Panicum miliaceum]
MPYFFISFTPTDAPSVHLLSRSSLPTPPLLPPGAPHSPAPSRRCGPRGAGAAGRGSGRTWWRRWPPSTSSGSSSRRARRPRQERGDGDRAAAPAGVGQAAAREAGGGEQRAAGGRTRGAPCSLRPIPDPGGRRGGAGRIPTSRGGGWGRTGQRARVWPRAAPTLPFLARIGAVRRRIPEQIPGELGAPRVGPRAGGDGAKTPTTVYALPRRRARLPAAAASSSPALSLSLPPQRCCLPCSLRRRAAGRAVGAGDAPGGRAVGAPEARWGRCGRSGRPLLRSIWRTRSRSGRDTVRRCSVKNAKLVLEGAVAYHSQYPVR